MALKQKLFISEILENSFTEIVTTRFLHLSMSLVLCKQKLYFAQPKKHFVGFVAVGRLHVGDIHAVGWGEGPWALVSPVKAIRVGVFFLKKHWLG